MNDPISHADDPVLHHLVNTKNHYLISSSTLRPSTCQAINAISGFKRMHLQWFIPSEIPFELKSFLTDASRGRMSLPERDR